MEIAHSRPSDNGQETTSEQHRTNLISASLPKGLTIGRYPDTRPKQFYLRGGRPRKQQGFATEQERNDVVLRLVAQGADDQRCLLSATNDEWREFIEWKQRFSARAHATVQELIDEYLTIRIDEGMEGDTLRHTRLHLGRFREAYGPLRLAKIRAQHVRDWLNKLRDENKFGPVTLRHHRKNLNIFFSRAVREHWTADNPCRAIPEPKVVPSEDIAVMSLRDAFHFFKANRDEVAIGRIALEAFAGLRHTSVKRVTRCEIDEVEKGITLPASKHKTGRRHYIDGFPRSLWKWIRHAPPEGWEMLGRNYGAHKSLAFVRARIANPGNVFRHTFATMHLAAFRDAAALAVLLTHRNQAMLYQHYKGRGVSQAVARAYFMITPRTVQLTFERFCRLVGVSPDARLERTADIGLVSGPSSG